MKFKSGLLVLLTLINVGALQASEPVQCSKRRTICKAFLVGAAVVATISTGLIATAASSLEESKYSELVPEVPDLGCPKIGVSKDGTSVYWVEKYRGENCRELISYTNDWQKEVVKRKQRGAESGTRLRGSIGSKECAPEDRDCWLEKYSCYPEDHACWLKKDTCLSGRPADLKQRVECSVDLCPKKGEIIRHWRNSDGLFLHSHSRGRNTWYGPDGKIQKIG